MNTKCGILGIYSNKYSYKDFVIGLSKLQHRGQESFGISYLDSEKNKLITDKKLGLIKDNYDSLNINIASHLLCGHVRYSTSGNSKNSIIDKLNEAQPLSGFNKNFGEFVLCHNGNIPNIAVSSANTAISDTMHIFNIIKNSDKCIEDLLITILNDYNRSFNLLIMTKDAIYALKDRYGTRPLCLGIHKDNYCVASETCALYKFNYLREINTGEIVKINSNGLTTLYTARDIHPSHCIFEYIYFMDKESYINNDKIYNFRYKCGIQLAKKDKKNNFDIDFNICRENTIVVGAPRSGISSGEGYAVFLNLPYLQVLKKNKNINRTFILENNESRDKNSKKKYYIDESIDITNKNIILLDDSLVRGITLKNIINLFKKYKIKSIHVRIASPAIYNECFYGIDIPNKHDLIANKINITKMASYFDCNTLEYLSVDEMTEIFPNKRKQFCTGCFNGNYSNLEW